jgi:iron complex transport system substrate-binding protein
MTLSTGKIATALALALAAIVPAGAQQAEPPGRIVAIGGSITEIVYALGEQDRLIARDSTSIHPAEALELPDVGYMRALSPEGVLSVDPDLILALEGSGPPEAVEVLERASVSMVTVPEGFDAAGVVTKIEAVGEALGASERAAELAARVEAEIAAALEGIDEADRPRVLFILSMEGGRILASGTATAAAGMLELAGAQNAITGYTGYKQLTDEAVIEAAPDVILMMARGGDHGADPAQVLAHPAIASTPAGRDGRLVRMDGAYLLGFGPRTGAAAHELAIALRQGGD